MSIINHQNIDEWLFNYFEGNLSGQESETLTRFLNANPTLKADYHAWKASYVNEPPMAYPNAGRLLQEVPATAMKKWIGWGLVLVLGLLIFFLLSAPDKKELPAEHAPEQPAATQAQKETQPTPVSSLPEEKKGENTEKGPEYMKNFEHSGKDLVLRKGMENIPSEAALPFLMQRQSGETTLGTGQSHPPDSLEIIVKPHPASHPGGKSSKQRTRKKPMTVIRIRDTGF